MQVRKSLIIGGGVVVGLLTTILIAVLSIAAYSVYKSFQIDYQNHQAVVAIIQYNLQQGRLMPVPVAAPPAVATPPPAPADPNAPQQPHPSAKEGKR